MIDFKVGNSFFKKEFNIGYEENGKQTEKSIDLNINVDESVKIKEIFKKLEKENNKKGKLEKELKEQEKIIELTNDKKEMKEELTKLHKIEKDITDLDDEYIKENKELGEQLGNIFFKDEVEFLKSIMSASEYEALVDQVGFTFIGTLINQNQKKYMNMIQQ